MIPDGARVFVVDDDASFVRSTLRLLASWGIEAEGFTSASEFLAHGPGDGPACALVDLRMPGVNGFDLQEALSRGRRSLPIVFMSGHTDAQPGVDAMLRGAIDFLTKPVGEQRLLAAVERALAADARERAERGRRDEAQARLRRLPERQRVICELVTSGMGDEEIAAALGASAITVRALRNGAMRALGAATVVELLRIVETATAA
ncbi:MAG TPA: response regulator [Anaeromyxobacteraceae bacterium]|nr:response regulator [Anaeromyxobacteraceae bacterium]